MRDVEYIRYLYEEEGLSLSEIAGRTEHDFRTVRKYAYQNDWSPKVKASVQGKSFPVIRLVRKQVSC